MTQNNSSVFGHSEDLLWRALVLATMVVMLMYFVCPQALGAKVPMTINTSLMTADDMTSADGAVVVTKGKARKLHTSTVTSPDIQIRGVMVFGPTKSDQAWAGWAEGVLNSYLAGSLQDAGSVITANNLTGSLNQIPWMLVDIEAVTSDVALADLTFEGKSTEIALDTIITFGGSTYTPLAPLFEANGKRITSGSATQRGKRVLVLVSAKYFTAPYEEVAVWLGDWPNFRLALTATYRHGDHVANLGRWITLKPWDSTGVTIKALLQGGMLEATGLSLDQPLEVWSAERANGPWRYRTSGLGGQQIGMMGYDKPQEYFQIRVP